MKNFLLKLILLTSLTSGIYYFMGNYIPAKWYYAEFLWLPCFIAIVTAILHWGLVKRSGDSKKFIRYYMGSTGLKLFIYLTIIIVFAFINKPMVIPFALSFFFFYFSFTVFEVAEAYKNFGNRNSTLAAGDASKTGNISNTN
ncbi:MAG: hypothetical protein IPJ86_03605 [Bacteroidetes bacterium]|nr:hypothetical protein [Bacteroidota bacterium]MBK9318269.1 hypothetical protein [Bacteroidota bacterium]